MMEEKDIKCCGGCCWFYGEDTDGYGFCAEAKGEAWGDFVRCDQKCKFCRGGCDNPCFVSKEEMRHHMAVLFQYHRWLRDWITVKRICPDKIELEEAAVFAYKYMKEFGKL